MLACNPMDDFGRDFVLVDPTLRLLTYTWGD